MSDAGLIIFLSSDRVTSPPLHGTVPVPLWPHFSFQRPESPHLCSYHTIPVRTISDTTYLYQVSGESNGWTASSILGVYITTVHVPTTALVGDRGVGAAAPSSAWFGWTKPSTLWLLRSPYQTQYRCAVCDVWPRRSLSEPRS